MTTENTLSKLNDMRMTAMAERYMDQLKNPEYQDLSFEDRFAMLVDIEWGRRKNAKLDRLIKSAEFRESQACIENVEYFADRKLDKTQILRLSTGRYIQEKHNIIIKGASGNGKTYMGCACER
ncbi:hypothetical protein FGG79_19645 [Bacillus sp. BHET2]|uniref:ATP-binding protein n=1 Tax=Bacillus sp. BHET2 TaxID=2583818 RepID=UPI00110EE4E8|nr:ATP-binding protein [Bacillus sp. BHET2]TMU83426.1 hypothetical protein FGG79_19645 [Bacillus sp. BHET2]